MANYLISHYKGKYRILCPYDLSTNQFPRKLDGTFEDIDCYIKCYNGIQIFYYGHSILEAYIPSVKRGLNIIRAIKEAGLEKTLLSVNQTDEEVVFKFHARNMESLEKFLRPVTSGANISPFSTKNLPRARYVIPDGDLNAYKEIVSKLPRERILELSHMTKIFMESLSKKKADLEAMKLDMAKKGLKGKDYIHSIGKWNEYLSYLNKNIK